MRTGTDTLKQILTGSFDYWWDFDLFYDGQRLMQKVPVERDSVLLSEKANAKIQQSGSLTVIWGDDFGRSLSPAQIGDALAPFGAAIDLYCNVFSGLFVERVLMGRYEITDVPSTADENTVFQGEWITLNSVVRIEFKERLAGVAEDRFDAPSGPRDTASTYAEYARISGLPITQSTLVADAPITRAVAYEEERIDAVYDLADTLGAIPHMLANGTLSVRPQARPATIDTLRRGENGSIVEVGHALSSSGVNNRVVVRGKASDDTPILGVAQITEGPLRVANSDGSLSPFRRRTRFLSSDYVVNSTQGQEWAERELAKSARLGAITLPVTEIFNPLRERGDPVELVREKDVLVGRVVSIDRRGGATMKLGVEIS